MVSVTELARCKEKDTNLAEDILVGVKQHAEGEASHHELEASQQEHISRTVVRKYKLFSKKTGPQEIPEDAEELESARNQVARILGG